MPHLEDIVPLDSILNDSICVAQGSSLMADSVVTERVMDISDMFGSGARLALDVQGVQGLSGAEGVVGQMATNDVVFGVPALICFLVYCLMVYYFRAQVVLLLNILRGDMHLKKLLDENNFAFTLFLRLVIGFGLLMCAMVVVSYVYAFGGWHFEPLLDFLSPRWMGLLLCLAMWGVAGLVWIFQVSILKVVGKLTLSTKLTEVLIQMRSYFFGLFTIINAPLMMMMLLQGADGIGGDILSIILLIQLTLTSLWMIIRTFMLFVEQKTSSLYWFLYLCGVEIFPLSFLVLFALKNA